MDIREALTFDDVLLVPGASNVLPADAIMNTNVTQSIELNIPILSSAMDTVTEAKMAIALAQSGGMGVIHRNLTDNDQASHVRRVKRFVSGTVYNPITLHPNQTLAEAKILADQYRITGFPVINETGKVLGILTNRDMRFVSDDNTLVSSMMTSENLAIVSEPITLDDAKSIMHARRIEKLLVVDKNNKLTGLLTTKDLEQAVLNPIACKDELGRLRVAAASTVGDKGFERSMKLIDAGVDLLVIDTAHGHSASVSEVVSRIKRESNIQIVAGNVATSEATKALIGAGADAVKVGIGPGSICTTRVVAGAGMPQVTAITEVTEALKKSDACVISDGGIRYSGDIAKAIAAGANSIMLGSLFAGTEESPGEIELYQGRSFKSYRGMGSIGAMASQHGSKDRYFQSEVEEPEKLVPEGIEGRVPYKGKLTKIIEQLVGGLRQSMGYTGCSNIDDLQNNTEFVRITDSGKREGHVHDVNITKEAPNYSVD